MVRKCLKYKSKLSSKKTEILPSSQAPMCPGSKGYDISGRLTRSIQRPLIMDSLSELKGFRVLSSEDCSCLWIADDRFYNGSCDKVTSFIHGWFSH